MKLEVGMKLRDNDPRQNGRVVEITEIDLGLGSQVVVAAGYRQGKRLYWIDYRRIYDDGKPRHQGFSVVRGKPALRIGDKVRVNKNYDNGNWIGREFTIDGTSGQFWMMTDGCLFLDAELDLIS